MYELEVIKMSARRGERERKREKRATKDHHPLRIYGKRKEGRKKQNQSQIVETVFLFFYEENRKGTLGGTRKTK